MNNMFGMLKKAQEMQKNLKVVQEELGKAEVQGSAAGGAVGVTMTGTHEIVRVSIKPEAVDTDDLTLLEDMLKVACNDALAKANAMAKQKMEAVTGGMGLPGF